MFSTLKKAWCVDDLRHKLLFTLLVIVIYRLGNVLTVPFVDVELLQEQIASMGTSMFGLLNIMSGGSFSAATIFALGVQPYINASIIIQLLTVAIPSLEHIAKEEGEMGKKKMKRYTHIATFLIAIVQSAGYYFMLSRYGLLVTESSVPAAVIVIVVVAVLTAGASFITWLGEKVEKKGVGNGISIILLVGILSRIPSGITSVVSNISVWWQMRSESVDSLVEAGLSEEIAEEYLKLGMHPAIAVALLVGLLLLLVLIVFVQDAERRVPVQYAKRQVGTKMYGGNASYIPFKVSMTGVLPIIFAQSLLTLPVTVWSFAGTPEQGTVSYHIYEAITTYSPIYLVIYFLFIILLSYFSASIQCDPVEMSNQLKKNGGMVPGYRPGNPTTELFRKCLKSVTLFGAIYLGIVAISPLTVSHFAGSTSIAIGGTSVIIVVGVALETMKAVESKLSMYNYKGFIR